MITRIRQWIWRRNLAACGSWLAQLERADIVLPNRSQVAIEKLFSPVLQAEREERNRRRWRRDAIDSLRLEVARLRLLLLPGVDTD